MKIKLLTSISGYDENGVTFSHNDGDVVELEDGYAKRLIEGGMAEAIDSPKPAKKTASKDE